MGKAGSCWLNMRRFWKEVTFEQGTFGQGIMLDGRPLKTPKRNALYLPTKALADAVADEWRSVGDVIDPAEMPVTGFANAAIDHVAPDRAGFAAQVAAYAQADAFCYRADAGDALAVKQAEVWDPWLDWARGRYDVSFTIAEGVMHKPQPSATLEKLGVAVAARGTFELAAMAKLAHLSGSLVAVLAIVERAGEADTLWAASCIEELWQEELWGADHWALKNRSDRNAEFIAAAGFLGLLRP
jgi:chaperone required for assembly of F1-ATPase